MRSAAVGAVRRSGIGITSGKSLTDKIRIIRGKLEGAEGEVGKNFGVRPFLLYLGIVMRAL
jgi:hypothetical protein